MGTLRDHARAGLVAAPLLVALGLVGCGARSDLAGAARGDGTGDPRDASIPGVVEPPDDPRSPDGSERCDGDDDDGDGRIDEGIPALRCGTGACFRTSECVGGRIDACVPAAPGPEVCNEIDDDCDGLVDEGLPGERLSAPVTVRAEDEGDTGDCLVCTRAFSPNVMPVEDGLLALWPLDFQFVRPEPNTYVRRLATDGTPRGPVEVLTRRNTTFGMRTTPIREGETLITFCERFDDGTDHPAAALMDGSGVLLTPDFAVFDEEARCYVGVPPGAIWTGERYLVVWAGSRSPGLHVERVSADGEWEGGETIETADRVRAFAALEDGALVIVDGGSALLDTEGQLVERSRFDTLGNPERVALVRRTDGFDVYETWQGAGIGGAFLTRAWRLDRRGRPLGEAEILEPDAAAELELLGAGAHDRTRTLVALRLARNEGGVRSEPRTEIWLLDEDGERERRYVVPFEDEGRWRDVAFASNGGQTLMIYVVETISRNQNQVRLRRFGCDPDA